jgi:hypothetical protein
VSWKKLLASGEVTTHRTSKQEIDNLRALIARDMADASLPGLSADRQFATAYNAALQAGKIAIACSGYRVTARAGHLAIGPNAAALTDYFDACRRKRNVIDYDSSSVATETEAAELVRKAGEFHALVEKWVAANHAALTP